MKKNRSVIFLHIYIRQQLSTVHHPFLPGIALPRSPPEGLGVVLGQLPPGPG